MGNNIEIDVTANETASDKLGDIGDASKKVEKVVVSAMGTTEAAFDTAARGTGKLGDALDKTEGFTGKLGEGVGGVSDAIDGFTQIANHAADKQRALARAQQDVEQAANDARQAVEDQSQAQRDLAQSGIDAEQAQIDEKQALQDETTARTAYNDAVKKGGAGSAEAKQALIDLSQAQLDHKQALEDGNQAQRDASQAAIDAKQAIIDQKGATTDLSEANSNLASQNSVLGQAADYAGLLAGVLGGLSGIIGAVTAVQWAWNAAMSANPVGLIIVAVGALIAVIVYLATKTQFFQTIWKAIWGKIGEPVKKAWSWIKDTTSNLINWITRVWKALPTAIGIVFKKLASIITAPYRIAFNGIAWAWNNTVGKLSFSIPSWVPGIGGKSFSAPRLPTLAVGGDVLKSGLAYIHQGERVMDKATTQRLDRLEKQQTGSTHAEASVAKVILGWDDSTFSDSKFMSLIHEGIRAYVNTRNGDVQLAYGRGKAR
jgi:hypothetical protein